MGCPSQSKGSLVASSSSSPTREWWSLCTSLWLCFNTKLWCDLIKYKNTQYQQLGAQWGLDSLFQVLEVPRPWCGCLWKLAQAHTQLLTSPRVGPAVSRQKMHGLLQLVPLALLTLPFMPWGSCRSLLAAWAVWRFLGAVAIQLPLIPFHGITQSSQVLKASRAGATTVRCHCTGVTGTGTRWPGHHWSLWAAGEDTARALQCWSLGEVTWTWFAPAQGMGTWSSCCLFHHLVLRPWITPWCSSLMETVSLCFAFSWGFGVGLTVFLDGMGEVICHD